MSVLQEAEKLLKEMKPAEKAHLLQYIVRDLGDAFPGVESRPDVCGGERLSFAREFQFGFSFRPENWE